MKPIVNLIDKVKESVGLILWLLIILISTIIVISIFTPDKNKIDKQDPVENRLREIIKEREVKIKQYESQIDSLNILIGKKKLEYIYIQKEKSQTIKNYNHEKSIVNYAPTSEQFNLLSTYLKQLDSLDKSGYFEKP